MRLGKHEKNILWILQTWASVNPEWEWNPGTSYLRDLADQDRIERYEQGGMVPLWMLRRDVGCGKTVLARALKTLSDKGLIIPYGADLDVPCGLLCSYTKFVGLTSAGKNFDRF